MAIIVEHSFVRCRITCNAQKPNVFAQAVVQLRAHVFICANSQAKLSKCSNSVCHKVWHIRSYIIMSINFIPSTMIVTLVCFWLQPSLFYHVFYSQYLCGNSIRIGNFIETELNRFGKFYTWKPWNNCNLKSSPLLFL